MRKLFKRLMLSITILMLCLSLNGCATIFGSSVSGGKVEIMKKYDPVVLPPKKVTESWEVRIGEGAQ